MNADEHKIIGKASPRSDGPEKTTGKGKYVVDIALPDMLWCKVLRSPYPHADHSFFVFLAVFCNVFAHLRFIFLPASFEVYANCILFILFYVIFLYTFF